MNESNTTDVYGEDFSIAEDDMQPPRGYKTLTVLNLVFCSISILLCTILILAMTLPLFQERKRKKYSRFNLYLAYMAIPDLLFNTYFIKAIVLHTTLFQDMPTITADNESQTDPYPRIVHDHHDFRVTHLCHVSNMYLNVFVATEIYKLLRDSHARKRYHPPTIAKVSAHALLSYSIGIALVVLNTYVRGNENDLEFIVGVLIPVGLMIGLTCLAFAKGLVKGTKDMHQGRLRILTLYFVRIIGVSLLWLISLSLVHLTARDDTPDARNRSVILYGIALLVAGIQTPLSFACSLTKPDASKLIVNLVQSIVCCHCNPNDDDSEKDSREESDNSDVDPYLRRRSTIMVGAIPGPALVDLSRSPSIQANATNGGMPCEDDNYPSSKSTEKENDSADKCVEDDIETGTEVVPTTTKIV